MKSILFTICATIIIFTLALWAIKIGIEKQERNECKKWQYEATRFQGYYLTENQIDQCKSLGLPITISPSKIEK